MRFSTLGWWSGLVAGALLAAPEPPAESWQVGYRGADVDGPHVLGFWRFEADGPAADSSGKGHVLSWAGAVASPHGKYGGALESFPGWPVADRRHAATAVAKPGLSPAGAFSLEMWVRPKPDLAAEWQPVLIDKKYVAATDYQWRLSAAEPGGARRMQVTLGFGTDSEVFRSDAFKLTADWQHLAFVYDGAGEVRFFRNGTALGTVRRPGRGPVAPGRHVLSIGDRVGSNYAGFPGYIDDVRLCAGRREFRPVRVSFELERRTWRRMEAAPPLGVVVRNLAAGGSAPLTLRVGIEGRGDSRFAVPALAPGAAHRVEVPIDTTLRPDTYRCVARVETTDGPEYRGEETLELVIVPRPLPHRLPVVMWGINGTDNVRRELARLKDLGFTHCLGGGADLGMIWAAAGPGPAAKAEQVAATKDMLDFALAHDLGIALPLSPGHWLKERPELQRVDRAGRPYSPRGDVNAARPELAEFGYRVGASVAQTYHAFPAWTAALIDTEVRDSTQLSFSAADREAYRKFSGLEIPEEVPNKRGVSWTKLPGFPADRVLADDHPVRRYLHWFWTVGDGWNALHSAVHRGVHSTGRADVWTWFDPAIRAPSVGGSGGEVDVLSQWTYTNPDPLRIGYFADEVFALAAVAPQRPRVMKMTQLFWYRSQTAPKPAGPQAVASPFEDHDPDAAYITISPVHLREAFWTKLARPVDGLMYHGWQALVPSDGTSAYRHTHPDTEGEFRRLHRGVVEPLGPTLLQVGDRRSDVAFLDSFTAQMFAGRGSYGYAGDEAYLTLLHAQLQPQVIYEETLQDRGLDGYRVLVLADCDVLTAGVAARIREFQQRGGVVIGDEHLAPAIRPDVRLGRVGRQRKGDGDHARLLASAAQLRTALGPKYQRFADSTHPEVVVRARAAGASDYVFAVNDRRTFGTYVGQHGLVMEDGLPATAELSVARARGYVYDLVEGRPVAARVEAGRLVWTAEFGPGEGGVFLVTPQAIHGVSIAAPEQAAPGAPLVVAIAVRDEQAAPVRAVVPLQVEIADPAGRRAEFSGYYGAKEGALTLRLDLAPNDRPGVWQIRVRELASGRGATRFVHVPRGGGSP